MNLISNFIHSFFTRPQLESSPEETTKAAIIIQKAYRKHLFRIWDGTTSIYNGGTAIIRAGAPALEALQRTSKWLTNLRKSGILLSSQEFTDKHSHESFYTKPDIGRLLGRFLIEKTIKEFGLNSIKVPQKFIIIYPTTDQVTIRVDGTRGFVFPELQTLGWDVVKSIKDASMELKCRAVEPVDRVPSREEVKELLTLVVKTHFFDCSPRINLIIAADGIYIIDTEIRNFFPLPPFIEFRQIGNLFTEDADKKWYKEELDQVIEKYRKEHPNADWSKGNSSWPSYAGLNKPFPLSMQKFLQIPIESKKPEPPFLEQKLHE